MTKHIYIFSSCFHSEIEILVNPETIRPISQAFLDVSPRFNVAVRIPAGLRGSLCLCSSRGCFNTQEQTVFVLFLGK